MSNKFPKPKFTNTDPVETKIGKIRPELLKKLKLIIEENKQIEEKEKRYIDKIKLQMV